MRTLDRYVLRSFLSAVGMWFVVFMALRIVTDLFVNMDEFAKLGLPFGELVRYVATYYGYQSLAYFTELGGVIIVAAAAFTLAMMNHTNELTAILASGVSLYRVVVPIVACSVLLSGLIVLDQEMVIPRVAEMLVRDRDDVYGRNRFQVRLINDSEGTLWYSPAFLPHEEVMERPVAIVRDKDARPVARVTGRLAEPRTADGRSGWLFTDGVLSRLRSTDQPWEKPPRWNAVYSTVGPGALLEARGQASDGNGPFLDPNLPDPAYGMVLRASRFEPAPRAGRRSAGGTLVHPRFIFREPDGRMLGAFVADSAQWKTDDRGKGYWALEEGKFFCPSDLTVDDLVLRRSDRWLQYMSTEDLTRLIRLRRSSDVQAALLTRHTRFTDPVNNLVMLLLGLPFILSRERNIKASATLCLLMVVTFFVFIYLCRTLGLPPSLAAWLPILLFGPVAAVMFDSIKT